MDDSELEDATRAGWAEGEAYDRLLREQERSVRNDAPTTLDGLPQELRRLAEFHDAVVRSRSWRALQAVRRLFGRAW